jgi:hypothetical protein
MPPTPGADAASDSDTGASDYSDLIAELEAGAAGEDAGEAKPAKGGKPAGKIIGDEDDADEDASDAGDEDADGEEKDEAKDDADEEADEEAEKKPAAKEKDDDQELDPATRRKLAVVQRAEKRHKEQVARDRAELAADVKTVEARIDAVRKEWEPKIEAAQRFEAAQAKAKRDPVGLLLSMGFSSEEIEEASKQAYLYVKGDKDPKTRAAAQRMQREREQGDDVATLRRELEELKKSSAAEKQQATVAQKREQFTDQLVSAARAAHQDADDKTAEDAAPVVVRMLAKNPAKARAKLFAVADELGQASGEVPDPDEVIAELEKRERADLEDRGVDLAVFLAGATTAPPAKRGKTLGVRGGGGNVGKVSKSDDDLAAEVAREIAAGLHLTH